MVPGVTVERKVGIARLRNGQSVSVVDLPGAYSLSPATPDEQVTTGVTPDLVRLCVGIETIDDVLADLDAGFRAAKGG